MDRLRVRKPGRDAGSQEGTAGDPAPGDASGEQLDALHLATGVFDSHQPHAGCLVIEVSRNGSICNLVEGPGFSLELPQGDLTGSSIDAIWPDAPADRLRDNIKHTIRGRQVRTDEFEDQQSGKHFEFIFVVRGRDRVLIVARDVSQNRSEMTRIQTLAYIDETTGLPNREHLFERLREIMENSRLTERRAAVLCLEIDQVDLQNAASGSTMQDILISALATRLTDNLRGANDPHPIDRERFSIAARVDFRQFIIVLPKIEGGNDAVAVAERILTTLQRPIAIGETQYRFAVHVGISLFPQDGTDAKTLVENAHAAMQDAKTDHSSQYKFHTGTVKLRALQRQDLELELRTALDCGDLDLNFLPIIDVHSGKTVTAEALLRWPQAVFGSQPVEKIISLAEKTGLIVQIGNWVMQRGCEQLRCWHEAGHTDLRLALNLSIQEVSRSNLAGMIADVLKNCSLDPSFLDLEITEHILFRDALKDFEACLSLKGIGVSITVDDYGTGVCSLSHLAESPVDAVKIDKSLIAQLESGAANRAACAAAAAMARELGLKVIAEGVETAAQAKILRAQGCDYLQGYVFSRPLFADDFSDYLERQPPPLEPQQET